MTNWGFDDSQIDGQGNNNNQSPGGLRQFAEAQQQENKLLRDQLAKIQEQLTMQSVKSVFDELGVPGAAQQYKGDADPQKIKEWVDAQRQIFGGPTQGTPNTTPTVDDQQQPQGLPPMLQQQFDQFTQAGQQGQPLGSFEQASANVNDATSVDALVAAMQNIQR